VDTQSAESLQEADRADGASAPVARVIAVSGARMAVQFPPSASGDATAATVGDLLAVRTRRSLLVGILSDVRVDELADGRRSAAAIGQLDVLGEIVCGHSGEPFFQRGLTSYPTIGSDVGPVGETELRLMFEAEGTGRIAVGHLKQESSIAACIRVDDMLHRHFAVLGSTGAGKSSAIAVILREVMVARPDLRILLVDPHDEYQRSFGAGAYVLGAGNFKLPFWLMSFDEIVRIIFGRQSDLAQEIGLLSELIPLAKNEYRRSRAAQTTGYRSEADGAGYTVDTPVPYRLQDLIGLIESRMGKLENNSVAVQYQRLLARINAARNNRRYSFIFDGDGDSLPEILAQLFRLQSDGPRMTIMQMAGLPSELFDPVVSTLFRLAFDFGLHGEGALPLLVVCEEAHHYAHADRTAGFQPARDALSRIAKEGRKHGVFLGLVTQRPAELDPTLLSQCGTVFAMRLANEEDQRIVRAAISDPTNRLLDFLTSLGTRDALAFGEGVSVAIQMRFNALPATLVPQRRGRDPAQPDTRADKSFVSSLIARWRGGAPAAPAAAPAVGLSAGYGLRSGAR
jgi:DNA helicase HerA-like ATPase